VRELSPEFGVSALCRVLEVPRSSANYRVKEKPLVELSGLKTLVAELRAQHRNYGVKRMYKLLGYKSVAASRSEVHRAFSELGILKKAPRRTVRTTDSDHGYKRWENLMLDLVVTHPDEVWVADVTGIYLNNRWVYLALLMDVYTRFIVGWGVSNTNDSNLTLAALTRGFALGRSPETHHSDQGSTYASTEYIKILSARGIQVSMAAVGEPRENGYAERLNRTVKEEEARKAAYSTVGDVQNGICEYVEYYNQKRLHTSLKYKTPFDAFQQFWEKD